MKPNRFHMTVAARPLAFALSVGLALTVFSAAQAARTTPRDVALQKDAGPYRIVLHTGPAEQVVMTGGMRMGKGERMLGGAKAMCAMKGQMAGPTMMQMTCNHHVEIHVYKGHTAQIVMNARVSIILIDMRTHRKMAVPIMAMVGVGMSMNDYHYGNNI